MLTQLQVLNLCLSSKDISIITDKGLTYEYFPNYKEEFNFIYNHYKQYNQVPDLATFLKVFPNFEVIDVHESRDYLLEELYKERNETFLVETFNKIRELILKGKTDAAINLFTQASEKTAEIKSLDAVDILSDISRYDEYVDKCSNLTKYYVPTGFKELDQLLGGYDKLNEYCTIIARSGNGKTWTLLKSVVAAVDRGLTVGLFSGEMELNKVSYRLDTLMSHLSNTCIIRGNATISTQYKQYLDNLKENHKGKLFVLTPDRINGDPTVDSLISFIDKYKLDILFVDQQTLLTDRHRARTSFEKAANISKDLKMLQVKKHIPIITVTQQNRTTIEEGGFAGTEHIGQSDRIGQDSTTILSIVLKDDIMTIHVVKARDGGTGKSFNYMVNLDKGTFDYIPSEDDGGTNESFSPNDYEYFDE